MKMQLPLRASWAAALLILGSGLAPSRASEPAAVAEKLPPGATLTRIEAHPARIDLKTPFAYSQLVLTGQLAGGEKLDVTRLVKLEAPEKVVRVSPTGQVRPAADGSGTLIATLQGQKVSIPVQVSGQKAPYEVSFVRDVMPTLSRMGCNAGTCHGAQKGRNGFKLSLRGYDPIFDHRSLTDDLAGRRFNRAAPDSSLMLLKPAGAVPHVGGVLTQPGEPYYELLRSWIASGVKLDLNAPRVTRIEVLPKSAVIPLPGMRQQIAVLATFSDGLVRDVSAEAFLESSNREVATVDRAGIVTAVRRGETTILARYEGAYAASGLVIMGDRSGYQWQPTPEYNYIDKLVYEKLREVKILPSDVCTDAEFIRRVTLDLTGLLPDPQAVRAFLADTRPTRVKRDELVDRLIGSPDFIEHWTNKWADLLQVNRKFLSAEGAAAFRSYIRQAVASNKPYDKFVYDILTASGSNMQNPAASYYKILRDPGAVMENTTQLFLAVRFNCNKCHDHPFERWTQDQYYQTAAFFAQIERKEDPKYKGQRVGGTDVEGAVPRVEIISDVKAGDIKHARTGVVTPPAFPYVHKDLAPPTAGRREQVARWITSKDNIYFARSYANRLWSYMLGVGLIEPIDDIRAGNPPTNPKLLEALTEDFVQSGFNVQHILRTICKSRTYQHSIRTNRFNEDDEINYSHALARRLSAEMLYDAIQRATGATSQLPGLPAGARAAQLLDSSEDVPGGFFVNFGKPARESACECERSSGMMLGPVLNLVNGPVVGNAVSDPNNRINRLLTTEKNDVRVIEELYLAFLSRLPTPAEVQAGLQAFKDGAADYVTLRTEAQKHRDALTAYEKALDAQQPQWEAQQRQKPVGQTLDVSKAVSKGGAKLTRQPDGSFLASGKNPSPDTYKLTAHTQVREIHAIRLEVLPDPSLPMKGPGRAPNGNFVLNEFTVTARALGSKDKPVSVALHHAQADFSQDSWNVAGAIDGNPDSGWAVSPEFGKPHTAYFVLKTPLTFAQGTEFTITMLQRFPGKEHSLGRFRVSVTPSKGDLALAGPPEAIARILAIEPVKRTPQQQAELRQFHRAQAPELARLAQEAARHPMPVDPRQVGAQDIAWSLINAKAFQFNH